MQPQTGAYLVLQAYSELLQSSQVLHFRGGPGILTASLECVAILLSEQHLSAVAADPMKNGKTTFSACHRLLHLRSVHCDAVLGQGTCMRQQGGQQIHSKLLPVRVELTISRLLSEGLSHLGHGSSWCSWDDPMREGWISGHRATVWLFRTQTCCKSVTCRTHECPNPHLWNS